MAWMAALPAAVTAVGGLLGGERANQMNRREAQKNRQFQQREAVAQRDFIESMRSTEWQTAVADMESAGINPALAYSQGGASSMAGGMPSGSQAAPQQDSVAAGAARVLQGAQLEIARAEAEKAKAQASTAKDEQWWSNQRRSYYETSPTRISGGGGSTTASGAARLSELLSSEHGERLARALQQQNTARISGVGASAAGAVSPLIEPMQRGVDMATRGANKMMDVAEQIEQLMQMPGGVLERVTGFTKAQLREIQALMRRQTGGR